MSAKLNIVGRKFARVLVLKDAPPHIGPNGDRRTMSYCRCDCGTEFIAYNKCLRTGHTKSCGCFQKERASQTSTTHGHTRNRTVSRTYQSWMAMFRRVEDPNDCGFPDYGGRGIRICERWRDFAHFLADLGECPPAMMLERIDNDGNYEPSNCKWATRTEQNRNSRHNIVFTVAGFTGCLSEICEHFHVPYQRVYLRLYRGWTIDQAVSLPDGYCLLR